MPRVPANGIELEYDAFGDPSSDPLVLIMGLGTQLTAWPVPFCEAVAVHGFHVIRFDNRDIGLSTAIETAVPPDLGAIFGGDYRTVPYRLADLAADTVGLLDALGVESAHLVGASMGGMIAQQVAVDAPTRVRSLCSIMSTTGAPGVGQPAMEALEVLFASRATTRAEAIDCGQRTFEVIGSPAYPLPTDVLRARVGEAFDRSYRPDGTARQLAAILASPDRTAGLRDVTVPAAVIHGEADKLINVSGGYATAEALGDIEPLIIKGMGHDLPEQLWPTLVDVIVKNARRA